MADNEVVVIFELKVSQSAAVNTPRLAAEAEGILNVHVPEDELMLKSVPVVELERVMLFCFVLKVFQSVEVNSPVAEAEEVEIVKV